MNIAVYGGKGTSDRSREGIEAFLTHAEIPWREIGPDDIINLNLNTFDAFYMPGGWTGPYISDIPPAGKRALRNFVAEGGSYIGVCAGAYFATDLVKWEGRYQEYELDLYRGLAQGPIDVIAPWNGGSLTELELAEHPINAGEERHEALYWGGPAFEIHPKQPTTVLAHYATTGGVAAVTLAYKHGQVLLMGCHLELGFDSEGRFDLGGRHNAQWRWLERAVRWTIEQAKERCVAVSR